MKIEEVPRVAKFLAGRHMGRSADTSMPVGRRDTAAKQRRNSRLREAYPNAYDPWSPEDDRELLRLHADGRDNVVLPQRFGRQPSAIRSMLRKLAE